MREQGAAGRCVTVVHHIDADGVAAGAVAACALAAAGVPHRLRPVKSLDAHHVGELQAESHALWFCDLGSTAYMHFPAVPRLVCDHHQLVRDGSEESFPHVNPLLDGLDGGEVSGAGAAFAVAQELDAANVRLLPLALLGATADRQDRPLRGINAAFLAAGLEAGLLEVEADLGFFGPESRPLVKFLTLANDPVVPGVSEDGAGAQRLLRDAGVVDVERTWSGLNPAERQAVRSALAARLLDCGRAEDVPRLWRMVVRVRGEAPGPARELQGFATLLNSTARYGRPDIGIAVASGERGAAYQEALGLLDGHRRHLVGALDALARRPVVERPSLQWVHLEDAVLDTVVGIVAGMALGGGLGLRQDRPLVAFAWTPDGRTKVSSRAPQQLKGRVDLALALREASLAVGGQGGGHPGAAGATIPRGSEPAFLAALERMLGPQLGVVVPPPRRAGQQLLELGA